MKHEILIQELQDVATQLGVTIRFERGDFEGDTASSGTRRSFLSTGGSSPRERPLSSRSRCTRSGLEDMYLKPAVREYIEDEIAKVARSAH